MARSNEREGFDVPTRLRLIEGDLDNHDNVIKTFTQKMDKNNQLLVGILVAVTTASILLVINIIALGSK